MDKHQRENWKKIKDYMEENGYTDNDYYARANAISNGKKDPYSGIPDINLFEKKD